MGTIARLYNFVAGTRIRSAEVDAELDSLVTAHNDHDLEIDNLQTGIGLTDGSVVTTKLADLGVTTAKLAASAVTTSKLADANVTTAKIADSSVTLAKMADSSVGTAELVDLSVTSEKIANAAVGVTQLSPGAQVNESVNNMLITALSADNAYNVKDAGCPNNDTSDCGSILNALVGKNYIYFPEGTYRFTNTWVISGDFTSVIFHPKAKIHVVGNINAITISGNYCKVYGGEIYSDGITANNSRYAIEVTGNYCVVEKTYIHDITYSAIFNNGRYNTFRDNIAFNVGWDAGSNYASSINGKWLNCRAIKTGRHGFSTDNGAQLIDFDGCYTEDIGNPADNQGHDPYHYEGCIGGNVINCISKWTANSPYVTNAGLSSVRLGIRISNSYRIIVNGLRVVIDSGFVPLDTARVFNWCYVESTSLANNTFFMRNVVVTNNSNFVTKAYLGVNSSLELEKCHFYGYVSVKQESVSGAMRCLKDCFIDGVDKTYYFYDHPYQTIGFEASNNTVKNSKGLINGGQLINGLIEKNVIDSCYDGILLGRYSGNVCLNTIIRQNYIKTIDHYAIQGSFNATAQQIKIVDNLFDGVINSLFVGEGGGCNALWKNNNPGSTLAVTTLVTGTATSILADMTSNYDVARDGATVRPANPDTSGATLTQLETEVNEIKAVMRIARLIF